jgi:hypothetical protein
MDINAMAFSDTLYAMLKGSTAQIAHLVFPIHRQTLKNQKSYFLPTLKNKEE